MLNKISVIKHLSIRCFAENPKYSCHLFFRIVSIDRKQNNNTRRRRKYGGNHDGNKNTEKQLRKERCCSLCSDFIR